MNPHIKYLSDAQRKAIRQMQDADAPLYVKSCRRVRTFNKLVELGVAVEVEDHTFALLETWREIDVNRRTRGIRGPYKGEKSYNPDYDRRYREIHERRAEPATVQIQRVTSYDNPTWDQRIEQILNS